MRKTSTASFVLTLKLNTSPSDERILAYRFRAGCRILNACIRHARKQLAICRMDPVYQGLLSERGKCGDGDKAEKNRLNSALADIRLSYGLSKYQFKKWVKLQQHRYKKHIDSRTAQAISDRAWDAVEKELFGNGKSLHFCRADEFRSLESNDNKTGIRYWAGRVVWNGLSIGVQLRKDDAYAKEAIRNRVKYCRMIRRPIGTRYHYYVQLILEGTPPEKGRSTKDGRVGIDPGTMSIAVASQEKCILRALEENVPDHGKAICRLERKLDRSRRAANPERYHPDGTVKKIRGRWKESRSYKRDRMRKVSLERKQAASRRQAHERLANEVIALGNDVYTEEMNYRALQRRKKETTVNKKGRYDRKGRFGKSLLNGAPAMLLSIIDRKLGYFGAVLHKVNTRTFRASQYNHVTDEYVKKRISKRYNTIEGKWVQRDLYSAFLLMNADDSLQNTDRERCLESYNDFLTAHDLCIEELKTNPTRKIPASFGIRTV